MFYGKFNDTGNVDILKERILRDGDRVIANPTDEMLKNAGFKPIKEEHFPENSEKDYELVYREDENFIYIEYKEVFDVIH